MDRPQVQTYRDLLTKLPGGNESLENCYSSVEITITNVKDYVDEWLRYQALWDLQPDSLNNKFGEDIGKWMKLLTDIKKSRATFDTSDTKKEFGPVVIDYGKVQSKVSLKYDSWHKDALSKFGNMLGTEMASFHTSVSKSRSDLEQQTIEAASTSDAVNFITYVQSLKRKMKNWEKQVNTYREGQRILERQRFQFPTAWLHVSSFGRFIFESPYTYHGLKLHIGPYVQFQSRKKNYINLNFKILFYRLIILKANGEHSMKSFDGRTIPSRPKLLRSK